MTSQLLVVVLLPLESQTKESARRDKRPSSVYCMAICFYCVAVGHMLLLCGSKTSAGPSVFVGICYESYHLLQYSWSPLQCNRLLVTWFIFVHKNHARSLLSIQACIPLQVKYFGIMDARQNQSKNFILLRL